MKTIKLLLTLGIVAALSGLLLSAVNNWVNPIIEENARKAEQAALKVIFDDCEFENVDFKDDSGVVLNVYEALGHGYIVKASAKGYSSSVNVTILIGFDYEGKIVAVKALEHQETDGFGTKCFEDSYVSDLYLNKGLDEEVGIISGATYTSNAVKKMIKAAQQVIKEVK